MLYHGDCLAVLRGFPAASIDMIFTDPPYRVISGGTSSIPAQRWKGSVLSANDGKIFQHNEIEISQYMPELFRVLKDGTHCYVMTNNINLKDLLTEAERAGFRFHNLLAWRKNTCTANRWYMKELELVCFFYKPPAKRITNAGSKQLFEFDNMKNKSHPTEKPWQLPAHYIENSSAFGATVLDPFMGTGSTGEACARLGRKFIGIEMCEGYFQAASERLELSIVHAAQ